MEPIIKDDRVGPWEYYMPNEKNWLRVVLLCIGIFTMIPALVALGVYVWSREWEDVRIKGDLRTWLGFDEPLEQL